MVPVRLFGRLACVALLSAPAAGLAHRVTDVIDADDGDDPFDAVAEVTYRRTLRRAKITREYNCDPANVVDVQTCPNAPAQGQLVNVAGRVKLQVAQRDTRRGSNVGHTVFARGDALD